MDNNVFERHIFREIKDIKLKITKVEDPIAMPFLRTSQGPRPQTLPSKM